MNEINLDNLNKLAMASTLINETMKNDYNYEIDILKKYVKDNIKKCQKNYETIVRFIDEHKNMFYKIINPNRFEVEPLNGFNTDAHGFKRYISNNKLNIILTLDYYTKEISTTVELNKSIYGEYLNPHLMEIWLRSNHWKENDTYIINFNTNDIESWVTNKKRIDNYIAYTERVVKEFENMVKDIVEIQLKKIDEIQKESNDALSNVAKVKKIVITYGV